MRRPFGLQNPGPERTRTTIGFSLVASWALVGAAIAGACGGSETGGGGNATTTTSEASVSASSSSTGGGPLPDQFTVTGVVTDGINPVAGAIVMQGGGEPSFLTGLDGTFTVALTKGSSGTPTLIAAKEGYRAAGEELTELPTATITLVLRSIDPPDNALGYTFGAPGVGDPAKDNSTAVCGHCHTTYVADFQTSAHARATRDPLVQDLYAGVASAIAPGAACGAAGGVTKSGVVPGAPGVAGSRCYIGRGVLADLNACGAQTSTACDDPALSATEKPTHFGHCADCHAIGIDGPAGGRDLLEAAGPSFEDGNHCDACHHIRDVDLTSKAPGNSGRLIMQRPYEKLNTQIGAPVRQAIFGPDPDVPNPFMGGSYQPKYRTSELCAGCHEYDQAALLPGTMLDGQKWPEGLPTLSTYSEWKTSSYDTPGTQCQFCHMPEKANLWNSVDVSTADQSGIAFGFGRASDRLRSHVFRDPLEGTTRLIDGTVTGDVALAQAGSELDAVVSLKNVGAGHAIPTGEPMRSLVLGVRAEGCGQDFVATGGMTIPDFGGSKATGLIGGSVSLAGSAMTWVEGVARAKPGDRIRVVRPSGTFDDYLGIGYFASATLSPLAKGMEIDDPVGEATVLSTLGNVLTLDAPMSLQPGDIVYLGGSAPAVYVDGDATRALAGAPGYAYARVMVDATGARFSPHYRATDIASDNRLPPGVETLTHHAFAIPNACPSVTVTATLLYRPLPYDLSTERSWNARDYVILETKTVLALQ